MADPASDTAQGRPGLPPGLRWREPPPAAALARLPCYPWLVVGTTCIGAFVGQLDASIVQLALPALEHAFAARLSTVSWVAIAYQLAFTALLPVFARLAEIAGRKLMYLAGFLLYAVAALLCGLAADLDQLIAARALLGVGGAMVGANSIVILLAAAGPARRGQGLGVFAAAQAVGISLGPFAGGVLLAELGWRWVFWVTLPFSLAAVLVGWLVVPQTTDLDRDRRFDWGGALLLVPALAGLLLLVSKSYAWGLAALPILGSLGALALLLPAFLRHERRAPAPLIDPALFRSRDFTVGVVAIVMSYALLYGMFFLMSFALVRGYQDSPIAAGLRLALVPVALGIVAAASAALQQRLGIRRVLVGGMTTCLLALILLAGSVTGAESDLPGVMLAFALFGAGLGLFIAPNNAATMAAAPDRRRGEAGGLLNLMRMLGCGLGVASATALLGWRLAALAGSGDSTLAVARDALLRGVTQSLVLLMIFAVLGGAAASLQQAQRAEPSR